MKIIVFELNNLIELIKICKISKSLLSDYLFSIAFFSEPNTGKSTIINKFTNYSEPIYRSKVSIDFINRIIKVSECNVKLRLWLVDLNYYNSMRNKYYFPLINSIILLFDKSNRKSFDSLEIWLEKSKNYIKKGTIFILIGNKSDLVPEVSSEEGQEKAKIFNIPYFEINAKQKDQVELVFELITRMLFNSTN